MVKIETQGLYVYSKVGFKFYSSPQKRTCRSKKQGLYNYGSDGKCMQKIKEGEITCETYLDLADDLRNDEEICFLDQMEFPGEILDVVMLQ